MSLLWICKTQYHQVQSHEDPQGTVTHLYTELFEKQLLEHTRTFYQKEAQRLYEDNDVSTYMIKVKEREGGVFGNCTFTIHQNCYFIFINLSGIE